MDDRLAMLQNREIHSFEEVVAIVKEATQQASQRNLGKGSRVVYRDKNHHLHAFREMLSWCLTEYLKMRRALERKMSEDWMSHKSEVVQVIGRALATDDYRELVKLVEKLTHEEA